jgi:hypothetical protein
VESLWMRLGLLFVGFLGMLGPLVLLMGCLRFREERESVLLGAVLKELNSPDLRGLFAVKVQCGLLDRRGKILIDLQDCSREKILDRVLQLSTRLPPRVQLVVNGMTDPRSRSTLTLHVRRNLPSACAVSSCQ